MIETILHTLEDKLLNNVILENNNYIKKITIK